MTRIELEKLNKSRYERQIRKNQELEGLAKRVGETMVLAWIKGDNWMGGLSDRKSEPIIKKLEKEGYTIQEILCEFDRQIMKI